MKGRLTINTRRYHQFYRQLLLEYKSYSKCSTLTCNRLIANYGYKWRKTLFILISGYLELKSIRVTHPFHHQALDLRHRARMCQRYTWPRPYGHGYFCSAEYPWHSEHKTHPDKSNKNRCCNSATYTPANTIILLIFKSHKGSIEALNFLMITS
jgi:hypothetical protein